MTLSFPIINFMEGLTRASILEEFIMIGLSNNIVKLEPYDPGWILAYEKEKADIEKSIGEYITDIQHIGSTSVKGLIAKPIIDIAVGVDSLKIGEKCIEPLLSLGYLYKGYYGVDGRLYFPKSNDSSTAYHIHMMEFASTNWERHILFRDYLRLNSEARNEYAKLKSDLAQKYKDDRKAYTESKADFISDIIGRARCSL